MIEPKKYDFVYEGKEYKQKSLKEISEITGINATTLQKRILRGRSIQEAIDFKRVKRNKVKNLYDFEFEGIKYYQKSLSEIAEITNISKGLLEHRLKRVNSIQESIDFKRSRINKVKNLYNFVYEGQEYYQKTLKYASEITGINYDALQTRILRGRSIQEAIDFKRTKRNKVKNLYDFEYEGKEYKQKSIPEIAEIVNISKGSLAKRLERGKSIQEAIK